MGAIDTFDFEGEYVTWTTDGAYAGTVFHRTGKFNCTNVCGTLATKDPDLSLAFLAYKLATCAKDHVSYVGNPKLMNGVMANIELSLPKSKPEQSKIAEILSTVDRAIEQTEALIAKQQRLKTGLMQDLLTRGIDEHGNLRSEQTHPFKDSPLGRIPVEWEVVQVADIISGIDAGWSPSCEDVTPSQGEWGVLKVSAISSGVFDPSESKRLPISLRPIESLEVHPDDVLISRANGVTELVGRCVYVHYTPTKLMLSDKTLRLKPRRQRIEPFMLSVLLTTEDARRQIMNFISGSSGQKNLSQKQIGSIEVILPSVQEQSQICSGISKAAKQLAADTATTQKLYALKTALMQDLLTGRKRVTALLAGKESCA